MATLHPFRALRPRPEEAIRVAAVPYDVVTTDEARVLAAGNPLSFLRVSRPELELPVGTDPHADEVYQRAAENFERLKKDVFVLEDEPSVYFYRLRRGEHEQTGLAACCSLDDYDRNIIKKHERTRRDKEDDRTRHMIALGAQTGPVFLTYRRSNDVEAIAARATKSNPLFDFEAADGVRHAVWRVGGQDRDAVVSAFAAIPSLYIADGHHRAASAARARTDIRERTGGDDVHGDAADSTTFLAVAFPHDQVQILSYNRIVKDWGGRSPDDVLAAVRRGFTVKAGPASPARRGDIAMYVNRTWWTLRLQAAPDPSDAADRSDATSSLDVSVLHHHVLEPILGIGDIRTDPRIDFIGCARGTGELERLVDSGNAAVAFSLYPVSVTDLMAVSDAGAIMPPKSTWFEPKLRDGLLIHLI